ncbi:MAG TPA: hypothetical protein VGO46_13725, partial [Gemmatimonadaceae bacterium]|nr:hypothetical protein [Gemmatimonadaceae bacterium]
EGSLPHAAPQSSASAAPVPRVLRRPIRAPAVEPERQVPQPRARVPEPASRVALSPAEVSQLTETVIRSIDRRLSAARERRGRS